MIKRAKTKRNLISILSGILVAVFACMVGITFANSTSTYIYGTNPNLPNAYAANQQVKVINDTLTTPIPFGLTGQGYEISIQYSMSYDFDLRLRYELSWSGTGSEDNVILHFADRDDYIVDNQYIYKATPITKGEGKLIIITGVDFADNTDESYIGQNLTINVTAEYYKKGAATYNGVHPLYTNSIAGNTWMAYKAGNLDYGLTTDEDAVARVITYNYRYNVANGLAYPSPEGAYRRLATAETNNTLTTENTKWIGGNRGYAGIGVYIVTGSTPVEIKARVTGIWKNTDNDSTESDLAFENNIKYNYSYDYALSTGWKHDSWDPTSKLFETCYYDKIIPANTTCYLEVVDSIEITSVSFPSEAYTGKKAVTNSIVINGTTFTGKISCKTIANVSSPATTNYIKSNITKVNTSKYANLLVDTNGQKTFNTSISLVNNTASYQTISNIGYQLRYRLSNGNGTFMFDTDSDSTADTRPEELLGSDAYPNTETGIKSLFNNPSSVHYSIYESIDFEVDDKTYAQVGEGKSAVNIAPYTSINILTSVSVSGANLAELCKEWNTNYNYDIFVELVPSFNNTTTATTADVSVEAKVNGTTVEFYLKNNTDKTLTGVNAKVNAYTYTENWSTVASQPSDWAYAYWKYYISEGGQRFDSLPTTYPSGVKSLSLTKTYLLDNEYVSDTAVTLLPNEAKKVKTITQDVSKGLFIFETSTAANIGSSSAPILVNAGTNNAMIMNPTANSYYVRFSGTYSGTDTAILKSANSGDNYNYFIGILRPGQILDIPMSSTGSMELKYIQYTSSSDITSWSDVFETQIANYLK